MNDNKPACEQQTETAHCTREGCTATDTEDRPNFGSDGNPLPHKYTSYEYDTTKWENNKLVIYYKSKCDYCGHEDNTFTGKEGEIAADGVSGGLTDTALKNVKVNEKTADAYVTGVINDALAQAQKKVQKAETKEQALAALDEISATVTKELQDMKISVAGSDGVPIEIDPEKLNSALKPLYSTIDELKNSLDDSFLSKDTIINVVDKLAGDVQGSDARRLASRRYSTTRCTVRFTKESRAKMRLTTIRRSSATWCSSWCRRSCRTEMKRLGRS